MGFGGSGGMESRRGGGIDHALSHDYSYHRFGCKCDVGMKSCRGQCVRVRI